MVKKTADRDESPDMAADAPPFGQDFDLKSILSNAQELVRQHPGPALIVAAAIGFCVAHALSRD